MNKNLNKPLAIIIAVIVLFATVLLLKSYLTGFATYGTSQGPELCVNYPWPLTCEFYNEHQCSNIDGCSLITSADEGYSIQAPPPCTGEPEWPCPAIEQWGQDNGYWAGQKCFETPGCRWIADELESDLGDAPASDPWNHFGMLMTAYPPFGGPPGVIANYPTVHFVPFPPYGPCHYSGTARLGTDITMELESDIGFDADGPNNLDVLFDFPDLDSISTGYGMDDGLKYAIWPAPPGIPSIIQLPYCQMTSLPVEVTLLAGGEYFLNIWMDFNHNGQWGIPFGQGDTVTCFIQGDTPEWVVRNQPVSGLGTFIVHTIPFMGYIPEDRDMWIRVQLTEIPVSDEEFADGSGPEECYANGETEDYYVEIEEEIYDLGDAPDSTNTHFPIPPPFMNAYPGVYANYPTVHVIGSPPYGSCHKSYFEIAAILGTEITFEYEADIGYDDDLVNNINPLSDVPNQDAIAFMFGMDDGLKHVPIDSKTNILPVNHCQPTTIPIEVSIPGGGPMGPYPWTAYLNVWFDFDQSGQWGDFVDCAFPGAADTPEWAVQNYPIPVPPGGLSPVTQIINVTFTGYVPQTPEKEAWMRVQLAEFMAEEPDGSGFDFCYQVGETEDYLVNLGIPGPECGIISEDTNLTGNLTSSETCITIGENNIILDCQGHTITGEGEGYGIEMHSKNNVIIKNCIIENFATGIYIDPSYNNTLLNNIVRFNGMDGIYLQNSHNNTMINITAYNNTKDGIHLHQSTNNSLKDITNYDNMRHGIHLEQSSSNNSLVDVNCLNNSEIGIYFSSSQSNEINRGEMGDNNLINSWNNAGIKLSSSSNNNITGVYMYNNKKYAVTMVSSSNNNKLIENNIDDNCGGESGVYIDHSDNILFQNNNVTNGTGDGIQMYYSNNSRILNNNIANNTNGALIIYNSHNTNVSDNNIISNNYGIAVDYYSSNNVFQDNVLADNIQSEIMLWYNALYNSFINQKISSYPTNISFTYSTSNYTGTLTIDGVDNPPSPDPVNHVNISKYINITNNLGPNWLFLNISYADSDIPNVTIDESTLKIWKHNNTNWIESGWNLTRTLNTTINVVGVNITNFSVFAPLLSFCGNGIINPGETCDGNALAGKTCLTQGFDGGTLLCSVDCFSFDESNCYFEEVPARRPGGAARRSICGEEWNCTEWGPCLPDNKQYRTCWDLNRCEEQYAQRIITYVEKSQKPEEVRDCEYTGTCDDGIQNGNEEGIDCGGRCAPCYIPPPTVPVIEAPKKLFPIWPILLLIIIGTFFGTMGAYERYKRLYPQRPKLKHKKEETRLAHQRKIRKEHALILSQEAAIRKRLEKEKRKKAHKFRKQEIEKARKREKREKELARKTKEQEKARQKAEVAHKKKLRKEHLAIVAPEARIKRRHEKMEKEKHYKKAKAESAELKELKKKWAKEKAEKQKKLKAHKRLKELREKEKHRRLEAMHKEKLRRLKAERRAFHRAAKKKRK